MFDPQYISPWHDVPLVADAEAHLYNMVVEIPMYSTAKMEVSILTELLASCYAATLLLRYLRLLTAWIT